MKRIAMAVVVLAGVGIAAWVFTHRPKKAVPVTAAPSPAVPAGPIEMTFAGRAIPRTIVPANAPVDGTVDAFFVDVGAEVIEGQLVGRVRSSGSDQNVQRAQEEVQRSRARLTALGTEQIAARLEVSRADADRSRAQNEIDRLKKAYERQKGLWAAGATARLVFEKSAKDYNDAVDAMAKLEVTAKAAGARLDAIGQEMDVLAKSIESQTAGIEQAKESAASGEVHSPADGIIVSRNGQPGDAVTAGAKLMEIATELASLEAIVTPDAVSAAKIHAGMAATVRINDQEVAGAVQDVQNGQVTVYFNAPEPIHSAEVPVQVRIRF